MGKPDADADAVFGALSTQDNQRRIGGENPSVFDVAFKLPAPIYACLFTYMYMHHRHRRGVIKVQRVQQKVGGRCRQTCCSFVEKVIIPASCATDSRPPRIASGFPALFPCTACRVGSWDRCLSVFIGITTPLDIIATLSQARLVLWMELSCKPRTHTCYATSM